MELSKCQSMNWSLILPTLSLFTISIFKHNCDVILLWGYFSEFRMIGVESYMSQIGRVENFASSLARSGGFSLRP